VARTSKNGIAAAENAADAETDIPLPNEIDGFFRSAWLPSGQHQTFNTREGRQRCGGPRARAPPPVTSDARLGRLAGPAARRGCRHPSRPAVRSDHTAAQWSARGVGTGRGHCGPQESVAGGEDPESGQRTNGLCRPGAAACGSEHGATMSTPRRGLRVASGRRRKNERQCSRLVAFGLCHRSSCVRV